jgi:hypothetical protein
VGNLTSPSFSESLLLGLVGLVIAIPSLWLLIRFALAPIIIASEDVRPWRSLQRSRELTLGRFWQVMGRYAVLIAWLFLIGVIVTLLITALGLVWHNAVALDFIYQFVLSLVGLPIGSVYLVRLYQALKSNQV